MFTPTATYNIARGLLTRRNPVYVQYYVTARCNLTCKQCNIIYANANTREATLPEIAKIAENLRKLGVGIVLLTGGEPFIRNDLPEIIRLFCEQGIHVRIQTNGLATDKQLQAAVANGARDISISLDSLNPDKQDFLNGSYSNSWHDAIRTIARVTSVIPKRKSFAAFGTVLSPSNAVEIPNIIRFATKIGWYVSLVPAHVGTSSSLHNFRSTDQEMLFHPDSFSIVDSILDECLELKRKGENLYDSYEYIQNIKSFIRGQPVEWRRRHNGRCDSPDLYFAIRPNGDIQPCCDHVAPRSFPTWHSQFTSWFREGYIQKHLEPIVSSCSGCLYGSYPEISIASRFPLTLASRVKIFGRSRKAKPWPISYEQMLDIIQELQRDFPVDENLIPRRLFDVPRQADATKTKLLVLN